MTPYANRLIKKHDDAKPASVPESLARYGEWMRVNEVAEFLAVSRSHILAYREAGLLVFINISATGADGAGADWRISKSSLAEFMRKRETEA